MGGKLSKKKSCDLHDPEASTGIKEQEEKTADKTQNGQHFIECEAKISKEELQDERTIRQEKSEAAKDENQTTECSKDLTNKDMKDEESRILLEETCGGKTEAVAESETNIAAQQYEETKLKMAAPSNEGINKDSLEMEDSNDKPDSSLEKHENKPSAKSLQTVIADLDVNVSHDRQTIMPNANTNIKDEIASEHTMSVCSDMGPEQAKQGTDYCETNRKHGNDLISVEKCGTETEASKKSHQLGPSTSPLQEVSSHDLQCHTLNSDHKTAVEDKGTELEGNMEQISCKTEQESMVDQHGRLVLQKTEVLAEQDTNLVMEQTFLIEQETKCPVVAEQQSTTGSPAPTEQPISLKAAELNLMERTILEESLSPSQQPAHATQAELLPQAEQMEQVVGLEEEHTRALVPGTNS